jgi:uncharacterized oxidoreductase
MILLPVDTLLRLIADIFQAEGCVAAEADRIARGLVGANLAGHDSHGVLRTPRYVLWLRQGQVKAGETLRIVTETPAFALCDGNFGFGQTIAPQTVDLGIRKARASGVAVIALRNSGHIGRVGEWAEMAAAQGFVSVHFVNVAGSQLVAPFGGVERRISTAPFAMGFPMAGAEPVIVDFATSTVAEGKVMVAASGGAALPPDVLIDMDGRYSSDPRTLYGADLQAQHRDIRTGAGAIRAMGEHKGSALALTCELLAGALTAGGCAGPEKRQIANGMLSFYIDPRGLGLADAMTAEAQLYLDWVKDTQPATPGGEVLLPGEPERRRRETRMRDGVPLPEDGWASICDTARAAGLSLESYGV